MADLTKAHSVRSIPQHTWPLAAIVLIITGVIYWLSARLFGRTSSPNVAYFNDLADAFLRGRLYLSHPPATYDLTQYQGRWYVPFPPLPALLMLPSVAVLGVSGVNTILFGAIIGATNVAVAFLLLESLSHRGWTSLHRTDNLADDVVWHWQRPLVYGNAGNGLVPQPTLHAHLHTHRRVGCRENGCATAFWRGAGASHAWMPTRRAVLSATARHSYAA